MVSAALLARCEIWLPDRQGELQALTQSMMHTIPNTAIVKWSFDKGQVAGAGTDTLSGVPYKILPLTSSGRTLGLLIIEPSNVLHLMIPEQQRLLETLLVLIAGALECREQLSRLAAEREELRNSMLAALSRDLRSSLTVLFSQAEILMVNLSSEGSRYVHQADELCRQTLSTIRLVNNMLDMVRIKADGFRLQTGWIALEEIIGSAPKSLGVSCRCATSGWIDLGK